MVLAYVPAGSAQRIAKAYDGICVPGLLRLRSLCPDARYPEWVPCVNKGQVWPNHASGNLFHKHTCRPRRAQKYATYIRGLLCSRSLRHAPVPQFSVLLISTTCVGRVSTCVCEETCSYSRYPATTCPESAWQHSHTFDMGSAVLLFRAQGHVHSPTWLFCGITRHTHASLSQEDMYGAHGCMRRM